MNYLNRVAIVFFLLVFAALIYGCGPNGSYVVLVTATPSGNSQPAEVPAAEGIGIAGTSAPPASQPQISPDDAPTPTFIPTPNPTRTAVEDPTEDIIHIVQFGDTLAIIAAQYGVTVDSVIAANNITNPNVLAVGQRLIIPQGVVDTGPSFKIIPDSELVYGPSLADFSVEDYLKGSTSFLAKYQEEINGELWNGADIIERVALEQSLNPRLLLALLEYETQWLSKPTVSEQEGLYPMNYLEKPTQVYGLYRQLDWAGKMLQAGYYGWRQRGLTVALMDDGQRVRMDPTINSGTAGVQYLMGQTRTLAQWDIAVQHTGLFATYVYLFGDPFGYQVEPLVPGDLQQPELSFPWPENETWYFTGGPHGGWGAGGAWAALDFVPGAEVLSGCAVAEEMSAAMADGVIARSEYGIVILDLDGDGFEGTGWTIFYLHVATEDRAVREGQRVKKGDLIGHPSCEGGFSTSSHLHVARRYNGEWIAADCTDCPLIAPAPSFVMDGWQAFTFNTEYDGSLIKGDDYREACVCRLPVNTFSPSDRN